MDSAYTFLVDSSTVTYLEVDMHSEDQDDLLDLMTFEHPEMSFVNLY
jgi:hypothetical protein